ncbi:MAG: hypothetical protein QXN16_03815 [Candidatus Micrarchaeaceae archaeon]
MTTQKDKKERQILAILFAAIGFGLGSILYYTMGFPFAFLGAIGLMILVLIIYIAIFSVPKVDLNSPYYRISLDNPTYDVLTPALAVGMIVGIFIFYFASSTSPVAPSSFKNLSAPCSQQNIATFISYNNSGTYIYSSNGTLLAWAGSIYLFTTNNGILIANATEYFYQNGSVCLEIPTLKQYVWYAQKMIK